MAFIPYNQHQRLLIPTDINDLVPEDHLVRAVNDVVKRLEIGSILAKYRDGGRDAFHPRILLKILFYGYACGERSSRVIEDKLKHDVFYMWLAAMQPPNFSTIIPQGENLEGEEREAPEVKYTADTFRYNEDKDIYLCPEGRELVFRAHNEIQAISLKRTGKGKSRMGTCLSCLQH